MPSAKRPLRLILTAVLALLAAALLWLLLGLVRGAIDLWRELQTLPAWLQDGLIVLIATAVVTLGWLAFRLLRPRRRRNVATAPPTRSDVERRLDALRGRAIETSALQAELGELDRRARSAELYVAVFGEISAGKSSVIRALAPDAAPATDVLGGTTRTVAHYRTQLADGPLLVLADVPGTREAGTDAGARGGRAQRDADPSSPAGAHGDAPGAAAREQVARDEALRAHVVLYLCAGDLTREQDAELRWLHGFGKPIVLALNKADRYAPAERRLLEDALRARYAAITDARVVISAGGSETFERHLPDGRVERVQRERTADVAALSTLLRRHAAAGAAAFEASREAAVLTAVGARADALQAQARERDADAIVAKYTRRAVVGAMAAVMPGSDLVIQGVLAAALIRELARLYDAPVRDIDIDAFLGQVRLTVRTSASLVLAIAGNAAKAFPGLGTLGGGVLHAIAYGLIFDSLGHAVAVTLREQHRLDSAAATSALAQLLADASAGRLRRIADMALQGDEPESE